MHAIIVNKAGPVQSNTISYLHIGHSQISTCRFSGQNCSNPECGSNPWFQNSNNNEQTTCVHRNGRENGWWCISTEDGLARNGHNFARQPACEDNYCCYQHFQQIMHTLLCGMCSEGDGELDTGKKFIEFIPNNSIINNPLIVWLAALSSSLL